jgi:1-acyl-sn-glycerol-3-phosphate acyltransferase
MIPECKQPLVERWFAGYTRRYLRRSFQRVLLLGELPETPPGPVVVCMSHSSWWDMLLAFWLSAERLGWDGYGPMDERQLRRYPILRRIGVFGVDRESLAGGREFLAYGRDLLAGRPRALWITGQGAMVAPDARPVRLYSGVAHLAHALGECHVVTAALDYAFWDEKLPEALVTFGPLRRYGGDGPRALLRRLEEDLEGGLDALGELRRARDPARCRVLLGGAGGISPTYDALRGLGARLRGERAPAAHGAVVTPPRWGPAAPPKEP